jgi:hypothetical protein
MKADREESRSTSPAERLTLRLNDLTLGREAHGGGPSGVEEAVTKHLQASREGGTTKSVVHRHTSFLVSEDCHCLRS